MKSRSLSVLCEEARLRWLGHVERIKEEYVVIRTWKILVETKKRKIKTGVERFYTKRRDIDRSTERSRSKPENMENGT